MVDGAKGGLLTIRMFLKKEIIDRPINQPVFIVNRPVFLFINRFQFCMKQPENRLGKPFTLNLRPMFQAVGWKIHFIDSLFMPGVSI